jgi:hypothetical protein
MQRRKLGKSSGSLSHRFRLRGPELQWPRLSKEESIMLVRQDVDRGGGGHLSLSATRW